MPVVFSRRFPFRRHFLGGSPFSWIYARLFWAGGWQLPAAPVKLAVFFVERAPDASSRRISGANAFLLAWMNGRTLVNLDAH